MHSPLPCMHAPHLRAAGHPYALCSRSSESCSTTWYSMWPGTLTPSMCPCMLQVIRVMHHHLVFHVARDPDPQQARAELGRCLDVMSTCIMPATTMLPTNPALASELWKLLQSQPYQVRFKLYGELKVCVCVGGGGMSLHAVWGAQGVCGGGGGGMGLHAVWGAQGVCVCVGGG